MQHLKWPQREGERHLRLRNTFHKEDASFHSRSWNGPPPYHITIGRYHSPHIVTAPEIFRHSIEITQPPTCSSIPTAKYRWTNVFHEKIVPRLAVDLGPELWIHSVPTDNSWRARRIPYRCCQRHTAHYSGIPCHNCSSVTVTQEWSSDQQCTPQRSRWTLTKTTNANSLHASIQHISPDMWEKRFAYLAKSFPYVPFFILLLLRTSFSHVFQGRWSKSKGRSKRRWASDSVRPHCESSFSMAQSFFFWF